MINYLILAFTVGVALGVIGTLVMYRLALARHIAEEVSGS